MMPDPLIALLIAAIITALGLLFFFPERGLYWRWQRARELTDRVLLEDALKHICQSEIHGGKSSVQSLAGALNVSPNKVAQVLESLQNRELLELNGSEFLLTPSGREYALRIIRAHRLYERFLAEETGFSESEWHDQAHRYEHQMTPDEIEMLSTRLGNPIYDPHGDPIPTSSGDIVYQADRIPITTLEPGKLARIVHLEDEPEVVYSQLVAEGLYLGQEVRLLESSAQRIRFWGDNDEHILAPLVAANISVVPVQQEVEELKPPGQPLSALRPGQTAQVVSLLPGIRGSERRRLMDLGLLPGTVVSAEMVSAGGDPTAYRIRGALIALRKTQSDLIYVCPEGDECLA